MDNKQTNDPEKEADELIEQDQIKEINLRTARDEAWNTGTKYYLLSRFIPFRGIISYIKYLRIWANYQSVKYGKPKKNIYIAYGLGSLAAFIVINFIGAKIISMLKLPGYSYLVMFYLTIIIIFVVFEFWIRSKKETKL